MDQNADEHQEGGNEQEEDAVVNGAGSFGSGLGGLVVAHGAALGEGRRRKQRGTEEEEKQGSEEAAK
jgi:hypothetical protein